MLSVAVVDAAAGGACRDLPTMPTSHDLTLLESAPAYRLYAWHNVMIACWSGPATGPAMAGVGRVRESLDKQYPKGISVVYLIADGAGLPDVEARAEAVRLLDRFSGQRASLALILYGRGFWVSAMRAAILGARLLTRQTFAMEIFGNEREAVGWLHKLHEERTGKAISQSELVAVLQGLAAAL
jgi:hypothetical protein